MYLTLIRKLALTAGTLLAIVACGGGGGYSTAGGGTGGTGVSYGSIAAFGSIVVNNVHFDVVNSTVTEDGVPGALYDADHYRGLKLGMVVEVEGTFDSDTAGTATTVTYRNNLIGPITSPIFSLPVGRLSTIVAAGQTVVIDANTVVAKASSSSSATDNLNTLTNTSPLPLAQGTVIEVSGLREDAAGTIRATRVEVKDAPVPGEIEVKGVITSVSIGTPTFQIGSLTVNYGSATIEHLVGDPIVGQFVEVKGASPDGGITLNATKVEGMDDGLGVVNASKAEVEGFVTDVANFASQSQFKVGNQLVQTTMYTFFESGGSGNIAVGVKVEVEGSLAGVTLTATKVSFK